jgi:medium-chain acyl-[acyl-carrier-protein] hydrolase
VSGRVGRMTAPPVRERDPALVRWRREPSPVLVLFGLAWAGAGAAAFRTWPEAMPSGVEVVGIRLPGRESRMFEPPDDDVDRLADSLASSIVAHARDTPVALLGMCTGAIVLFEVALRLQARRRDVERLIVVSQWPPRTATRPSGRPLSERPIREVLARLGHTPDRILAHAELLRLLEPTIRADLRAAERYRRDSRHRLAAPIDVFVARDDPLLSVDEVAGWQTATAGSFTAEELSGDHLFSDQDSLTLARAVGQRLAMTART